MAFSYRKAITIDRTKIADPVLFDAASSSDTQNYNLDNLTWSHTVTTSGSNRLLIVGVTIRNNFDQTVSSVTYNGTSMTSIGSVTNGSNVRVEMFYLTNPAAGAHNVVVNVTGNPSYPKFIAGAMSFTNVNQSTPLGAFASNSGSGYGSVSVSSISSNPGEMVVGTYGHKDSASTVAVGSGQTERWNRANTFGTSTYNAVGAGSTKPGYSNASMSWTISGTIARDWAIGAVSVKPASTVSTLTNFPLLVNISSDNDLKTTGNGGHVTDAQGDDINFKALDDLTCGGAGMAPCTLAHEIEKYVATTGELVAWVKLPAMNGNGASSDSVIYMYYGNSSITSSVEQKTAVWSNSYLSVYHLKENPEDPDPPMKDSTSSGFNLNENAVWNDSQVPGKIAGSIEFHQTYQYFNAASSTANNITTGDATFSAWIKGDSDAASKNILGKYDVAGSNDCGGYGLQLNASGYFEMAWVQNNPSTCPMYSLAATTNALNDNTWHYVVGVRQTGAGGSVKLYVDGNLVATDSTNYGNSWSTGAGGADTSFYVGDGTYGYNRWYHSLDEIRISSTPRTASWILAEYNNQNSSSTFYSVATEQDLRFTYRKKITIDYTKVGASCGTDLSNFPMLINISGDANLKTTGNGGHVTSASGYDIIFRSADDRPSWTTRSRATMGPLARWWPGCGFPPSQCLPIRPSSFTTATTTFPPLRGTRPGSGPAVTVASITVRTSPTAPTAGPCPEPMGQRPAASSALL